MSDDDWNKREVAPSIMDQMPDDPETWDQMYRREEHAILIVIGVVLAVVVLVALALY